MIDLFIRDKSLNTEKRIKECYDHYYDLNLDYEKIYEEYDRIEETDPKMDKKDKNDFFRGGEMKKIDTKFMKDCLLEGLKRFIDSKKMNDINDKDSELNSDISTYMNGSKFKGDHFFNYPDIYEADFPDKLYQK